MLFNFVASSIFQIIQHFDFSIGVLFFCVFVSGSTMFLYCYFGGRASIDIISYPNLLFQSSWFKLPTEYQKFIVVMIANAQIPLHYHGFGMARLNLATFAAVISNFEELKFCYSFLYFWIVWFPANEQSTATFIDFWLRSIFSY